MRHADESKMPPGSLVRTGVPAGPPDHPTYTRATPVLRVAGQVIAHQMGRLEAEIPGVLSTSDAEAVHRMRVATRRLRAALRTFRRPLGGRAALQPRTEELRWIAAKLGAVRNEDILLAWLSDYRALAEPGELRDLDGFREARAAVRATAVAELAAAIQSPRFAKSAADMHRFARGLLSRRRDGTTLRDFAPGRLERAWDEVRGAADALRESASDSDMHALRISAKRMRYAAEFFRPAYGKVLDDLIQLATAIQDALGGVNDTVHFLGALATSPDSPALRLATSTCHAQKELHLAQFTAVWQAAESKAFRRRIAKLRGDMEGRA